MFSLIVLLRFSSSLAHSQTKCLFLNDEPCMVRPTLADLNPVEHKYYSFMIVVEVVCFIPKNMCSKRNKRPKC